MRFRAVPPLTAVAVMIGCGAALAQQPGTTPRIGYLSVQSASVHSPRAEAFRLGLRQLGYEEGKNIFIDYRWAGSNRRKLTAFARDLVQSKIEVIVALEPPAARVAMAMTKSIPVVIRATRDPVAAGYVMSLAHPGGNVTGVTSVSATLHGKRMDLLRDLLHLEKGVVVLWNPLGGDESVQLNQLRSIAKKLALNLHFVKVTNRSGFEAAFRTAPQRPGVGLLTVRDPLFVRNRKMIADLASRYRMIAVYDEREYVVAGGLASYGADLRDLYRRAAGYVDKILKGAKPADLPVEQPTKFELVVNLRTAKSLGITIPASILLRADKVIE